MSRICSGPLAHGSNPSLTLAKAWLRAVCSRPTFACSLPPDFFSRTCRHPVSGLPLAMQLCQTLRLGLIRCQDLDGFQGGTRRGNLHHLRAIATTSKKREDVSCIYIMPSYMDVDICPSTSTLVAFRLSGPGSFQITSAFHSVSCLLSGTKRLWQCLLYHGTNVSDEIEVVGTRPHWPGDPTLPKDTSLVLCSA